MQNTVDDAVITANRGCGFDPRTGLFFIMGERDDGRLTRRRFTPAAFFASYASMGRALDEFGNYQGHGGNVAPIRPKRRKR